MREIACPNCRERLEVPMELLHQPIRCGGCQFVVQFAADLPRPSVEDRPRRRDYNDDDRPRRWDDDGEYRYDDRPPRRDYDDRYDRPRPKKKGSLMWLWVLLGVGFVVAVGVCVCIGFAINSVSNPTWSKFTSPDGRYSVDMPGKPTPQTDYFVDGNGKNQSLTTYISRKARGQESYEVSTYDLAADMDELDSEKRLNVRLDGIKNSKTGNTYQETSRRSLTVLGWPAKEVVAYVSDPSMPRGGVQVTRVVLVNKRVYYFVALGKDNGVKREDLDRFFNSFQSSEAKK